MTIQFKTGTRYKMTFIGDSELHVSWEVTKRTAKTITITDGRETKNCRVYVYDGYECVRPMGYYSMSPVLGADRSTSQPVGPYRTGYGV